jgi:hypothetical protein
VLAEKDTEAGKLKSSRGENESYTAYGCITGFGDKLPFWIITKSKTDRSHAKFGQPADIMIRHSPNGWTTEIQMIEYIECLSAQCHGERLMLIRDVYKAHPTVAFQGKAQELGIELLFVPAGGTSRFQPLNHRLFGELKSHAGAAFQRFTRETGMQGVSPEETLAVLVESWEAVSADNVRKAWVIQ